MSEGKSAYRIGLCLDGGILSENEPYGAVGPRNVVCIKEARWKDEAALRTSSFQQAAGIAVQLKQNQGVYFRSRLHLPHALGALPHLLIFLGLGETVSIKGQKETVCVDEDLREKERLRRQDGKARFYFEGEAQRHSATATWRHDNDAE